MNHEPDLNLNELSCVWGHPPLHYAQGKLTLFYLSPLTSSNVSGTGCGS